MPQATHHVSHRRLPHGADLYIAPTLVQRLYGNNAIVSKSAHSSVAIALREHHKSLTGNDPGYLDADSLTIEELGIDAPGYGEAPVALGPGGVVLDRECDDCASCDIGYHHRCRQPGGCPQA